MDSPFCAYSKSENLKLRTKSSIYFLVLIFCTLPLVSCGHSKVSNTNIKVADESNKEKLDQSKDLNELDETNNLRRYDSEITTQKVGDYIVKLKDGTKTSKGSVELSCEHDTFLHIDIRPDAQASLFQPDIFGPEKLIIIQVRNSDSIYEYMIVPLVGDKPKVDKTFRTFNDPPEVVKIPKNGKFTVAFQEPFFSSGARVIAPFVALKYSKGKLTLDKKEMRARGRETDLGDTNSIKDAFDVHGKSTEIPAELIDEIVSRYYLGRAKEAHLFFNKSWPKNRKGKAKAWKAVMDELKQSPYWFQIKAMNKL